MHRMLKRLIWITQTVKWKRPYQFFNDKFIFDQFIVYFPKEKKREIISLAQQLRDLIKSEHDQSSTF